MELQFDKNECRYLKKAVSQIQIQEQTQEVRLPDGMPDIGRVLGSWGQVTVRSKEWRGSSMNISGGVMTWVLYAPEDGTEPRSLDCWIPFQMKWDLPQTQHDGTILIFPRVRSVDARSTSARKLMVRCSISVLGEALEMSQTETCTPSQIPQDLQLLEQVYPVVLPMEAGEKAFVLEDELIFPDTAEPIHKVVYYEISPVVLEKKVLAGKAIFRGSAGIHMLYLTDEGNLCTWDCEVPFSQYTDLDRDYSPNADAAVSLLVTSMDMEQTPEGKLFVKCAMAAQYTVYDRTSLHIAADAYSTKRKIKTEICDLRLPVRLDIRRETLSCSAQTQLQPDKVLDVAWYCGHGDVMPGDGQMELEIYGQFQVLYRDTEGLLQAAYVPAQGQCCVMSDADNRLDLQHCQSKRGAVLPGMDGMGLECSVELEVSTFCEEPIPMICAMEMGEPIAQERDRASLILRRTGDQGLWDLAKECGSTVEAIRKANSLTDEPDGERLLLIPIP